MKQNKINMNKINVRCSIYFISYLFYSISHVQMLVSTCLLPLIKLSAFIAVL